MKNLLNLEFNISLLPINVLIARASQRKLFVLNVIIGVLAKAFLNCGLI